MEQYVDLGEQAIFVLMGLASVLALAVAIERLIVFTRNVWGSSKVIDQIVQNLRGNEIQPLKEIGSQKPKNIYARFASFSAEYYDRGH